MKDVCADLLYYDQFLECVVQEEQEIIINLAKLLLAKTWSANS